MHGMPAASASGAAISPLSLIDGPIISTTPASSSSPNAVTTSCSVPSGRPRARRVSNSTGRSRRPVTAISSSPSRTASSKLAPPSAWGKSNSSPIRMGAAGTCMAGECSGSTPLASIQCGRASSPGRAASSLATVPGEGRGQGHRRRRHDVRGVGRAVEHARTHARRPRRRARRPRDAPAAARARGPVRDRLRRRPQGGGRGRPVNPRYAPRELAHIAASADPALIVTGGDQEPRARALSTPQLIGDGDWSEAVHGDGERFRVPRAESDLAEILYTSGTTGLPKGVTSTHASVLANEAAPLEPLLTLLHSAPLPTTFGSLGALIMPLRLAMTSIALPRFDTGWFASLIEERRPTWLLMVPAQILLLLESGALAR